MPDLNTKEQIIFLSRKLNKQTSILKSKCRIVWVIISLITFYIIVYLIFIKIFHHYISNPVLLIILCIHIILVIIVFKKLHKYISEVKTIFTECKKLSNIISDDVDWGVFRKRQLYKQLNPNIQNSLDDFFHLCNSKLCLFSTGKRMYHKIYLTDFILFEMSIIYTVLSMFDFEIFGIKL